MNPIQNRLNKLTEKASESINKFTETPSKEVEEKRNEQYKEFFKLDGDTGFLKYYQNLTNPKQEVKKEIDISAVDEFLNKYEKASPVIQILRKDLMSIISDLHWIKESGNQNEQFSLDFCDALNALSVSI